VRDQTREATLVRSIDPKFLMEIHGVESRAPAKRDGARKRMTGRE
jgi:hypothetical protein